MLTPDIVLFRPCTLLIPCTAPVLPWVQEKIHGSKNGLATIGPGAEGDPTAKVASRPRFCRKTLNRGEDDCTTSSRYCSPP
jgi:hypothetical protein